MTTAGSRRSDLLAVLLLAAVVTALFADVLFLGQRFFIRDLTRYYYPTKQIVREVILGGEFPYWNRAYLGGQPMAANPEYEVFYPPQLLVLLPDYDLGYRLHILFHLYLAAIGMYAFLRSLALRRESAVFGGILFGVGGVMVSMVNLLPILFVVAWCPLVFLFARRFLHEPNVRDFSAAALLMGIQGLAGEPTSLVQTWLLVGTYGLYRGWHGGGRRLVGMLRGGMAATAMIVAGGLAGAAQLLPAAEHVQDSVRSRPFEFSLVTAWSMPWARPLELIYPNLFGHIYEKGTWYWASGLYPNTGSPFTFSIYAGILATALLAGAVAVRPRGSLYVLLLCGFSMLLALGGNTPLFRFLYDHGLASSVRYPEKWAFIALFCLMVLAAMMFERLLAGERRVIDAALGFLSAVTLVALVFGVFSFTDLYRELFIKVWGIRNPASGAWMAGLSQKDWWLFVARGAGAIGLLWWARRSIAGPGRIWFAAVVLFVTLDLAPVGRDALPRVDESFLTPPPITSQLDPRKERYRIFPEVDWYGGTDIAKKFFGTGDAVYWIVRNGMYPQTPATWGFSMVLERDYDKTALLPTTDFLEAMFKIRDRGASHWRTSVMAMSNAWYRSEYRDFDAEKKRVDGRLEQIQPVSMVKEKEWPRYYFASEIVKAPGKEAFITRMTEKQWPERVAFVGFEPFQPAEGRVLRAAETANSATIEVEAAGQSYLVASVTPHRYWRVTIDGAPAELHVTNVGYQGVVVPAGRHRVRMEYANRRVQQGAAVTAVVMLLLLGGVAFGRNVGPVGEERSAPPPVVPSDPEPHPEDVEEHPARVADDADA